MRVSSIARGASQRFIPFGGLHRSNSNRSEPRSLAPRRSQLLPHSKKGLTMKRLAIILSVFSAASLATMSLSSFGPQPDSSGFTVHDLHGTYAFSISGAV